TRQPHRDLAFDADTDKIFRAQRHAALVDAFGEHTAGAGMRDIEILLHHRAGAADLVADHRAEIDREQAVQRILDPVTVSFGLGRGVAGERRQWRPVAPGGGDGFCGRERPVHRRPPYATRADSCYYSLYAVLTRRRITSPENALDNKKTATCGPILLVPIDFFALLVTLLGFHRERRDRTRLQPFQRDRLAGLLAIAVGVVLEALQRGIDLGDQLALAVAGAQLDRTVGLRGGAVGEVGMVNVLFLQGLQRDPRFAQDLVLPRQKLGAKIIALAVVHERLFFGGSIVLQLFQGQPAHLYVQGGPKRVGPRAPYIAACCDRQYRRKRESLCRQRVRCGNLCTRRSRGRLGRTGRDWPVRQSSEWPPRRFDRAQNWP